MSNSNFIGEIQKAFERYNGKWNEKKGVWDFSTGIAERKAFLSKKKLTYSCRMKIDDAAKVVRFSEMLTESGSGLSSGSDDGISAGFGFKTESYNTFSGKRQGSIEEQSMAFGKDYSYHFDYKQIRSAVQEIVEKSGFKFEYQILPVK